MDIHRKLRVLEQQAKLRVLEQWANCVDGRARQLRVLEQRPKLRALFQYPQFWPLFQNPQLTVYIH